MSLKSSYKCRHLTFEFAERNSIPHPFNTETNMAGYDWLQSFLVECKLSLRTPEATSIARALAFNKVEVGLFFRNQKQVRLENNFSPHRIYNVDESGLSTVPTKLPKVLSPTGTRRVALHGRVGG